MNPVRKPSPPPEAPERQKRVDPAQPGAATPQESGHPTHSPVHALRARIEHAFRPPSERATLRIATMVLVIALSSWIAVFILLSAE